MTQKYDRFKAAPWFQEGVKPPVLIGGAGGIGSWLTLLLNRAGFETHVYDFDNLEAINMAGQLFMHKSIGQTKVDALATIVKEICQEDIIPNYSKVDINTMTNEIVFSAFDNMKARQDMFSTWAQNFKGNSKAIFIDGRLTAEQLTIFCIKGDDEIAFIEYEREHLFDDSAVAELPCTFKQTSHGAAMIAAHMVEMFTNWYSVMLGTDTTRNTSFFWEYFIPISYTSCRDAIAELGPPAIDELLSKELTEEQLREMHRNSNIPEGYVRLDSGEVVPIASPDIANSSSITVFHNLTPQEVIDKYGDTMTEEEKNELYRLGLLGTTQETDLTPEEVAEIDNFLNEDGTIGRTEQDNRDAVDLITEGINMIQAPDSSLTFEEDNSPSPTSPPDTQSLDDLPF